MRGLVKLMKPNVLTQSSLSYHSCNEYVENYKCTLKC